MAILFKSKENVRTFPITLHNNNNSPNSLHSNKLSIVSLVLIYYPRRRSFL